MNVCSNITMQETETSIKNLNTRTYRLNNTKQDTIHALINAIELMLDNPNNVEGYPQLFNIRVEFKGDTIGIHVISLVQYLKRTKDKQSHIINNAEINNGKTFFNID